jgi:hypothetical protein
VVFLDVLDVTAFVQRLKAAIVPCTLEPAWHMTFRVFDHAATVTGTAACAHFLHIVRQSDAGPAAPSQAFCLLLKVFFQGGQN